ncbi:MAG TPA: hypothetical protein VL096_16180, partial [Pirellulaceae bacterium]|nr:hypothetical protein [Pirellulaceae bacterium]
PADLTAGDPIHNTAMQSLVAQFERDDYQINGTRAIAEDRWSVLRGRQSIFSPHESHVVTEWRLSLCVHEQSKPHSYLAMRVLDHGYSSEIAEAIEAEWLQYATPLPSDVVTTAQKLLAKIPQFHAQDRDPNAPCHTDTNDASVARREWRQGGLNARDTNLHYYLRLVQVAERYEVATELHESRDKAGNPRGCWLCVDFIRLPTRPLK